MGEEQIKYAVVALLIFGALALVGMALPEPWGLDEQTGSTIAVGSLSAVAGLVTPRQ